MSGWDGWEGGGGSGGRGRERRVEFRLHLGFRNSAKKDKNALKEHPTASDRTPSLHAKSGILGHY